MNGGLILKKYGFTLLELMIVLVILGILVSLALPRYQHYVLKAHRRTAIADLLQLELLEVRYYAHEHHYTDSFADLHAHISNPYYLYRISDASSHAFTIRAELSKKQEKERDAEDGVVCDPLSVNQKGVRIPGECWK
jgi:type IV pilus assembly protein PilE